MQELTANFVNLVVAFHSRLCKISDSIMERSLSKCPICSHSVEAIGCKRGKYIDIDFCFNFCPNCKYTYVQNPVTDYARIYDEKYYSGQGPDPSLDYVFEMEHPEKSVRMHEWRGIHELVNSLVAVKKETTWLDFGCGNGGLVRHVRESTECSADGFEEGWIADRARGLGIPILKREELPGRKGCYDIVTAIEVMEHVIDPIDCLRNIRDLLKPGGLLFVTTGNAQPHRKRFLKWSYVVPEMHVGYYEPGTLAWAMRVSGFRPEIRSELQGFDEILKFKILKNLGARQLFWWEKLIPWRYLCHAADRRYQVSAHPFGWAN